MLYDYCRRQQHRDTETTTGANNKRRIRHTLITGERPFCCGADTVNAKQQLGRLRSRHPVTSTRSAPAHAGAPLRSRGRRAEIACAAASGGGARSDPLAAAIAVAEAWPQRRTHAPRRRRG